MAARDELVGAGWVVRLPQRPHDVDRVRSAVTETVARARLGSDEGNEGGGPRSIFVPDEPAAGVELAVGATIIAFPFLGIGLLGQLVPIVSDTPKHGFI